MKTLALPTEWHKYLAEVGLPAPLPILGHSFPAMGSLPLHLSEICSACLPGCAQPFPPPMALKANVPRGQEGRTDIPSLPFVPPELVFHSHR